VRAPWVGRSRFEVTGWIVLTIVIGGLLVLPWLRVIDGDDESSAPERAVADDPVTDDTSDEGSARAGGTTTTLDIEFEAENYAVGECLDWDPDDRRQATDTVDCAEPHRMEVVGTVELWELDEFPGDEEWDALRLERCTPLVEDYLGRPHDSQGRFTLFSIQPLAESWRISDHTLTCGLAARPETTDAGVVAGRVVDLDPSYHQAAGTCWAEGDDGLLGSIGCDAPHHHEVVGAIEVGDADEPYPNALAWGSASNACAEQVEAYTGEAVTGEAGDLSAYAPSISEASWAAGARSTDCWVSRLDSYGQAAELTGSLAAETGSASTSTTGSSTTAAEPA
jgi:hypothetical protein